MRHEDLDPGRPGIPLTVEDCAAWCRVDARTVRRWISAGDLRHIRISRRVVLVNRIDLADFLRRRTTGGKKVNVR